MSPDTVTSPLVENHLIRVILHTSCKIELQRDQRPSKNATIQVLLQSSGELFFALGLGNGSVTLTTEAIKENTDKFEH